MPSPFPGMDPYLETASYWRGFDNLLIGAITGALNAVLPPGLGAFCEERVYLAPCDRFAYPDVTVRKQAVNRVREASAADTLPARSTPDPDGILIAEPEEAREGFVEIRSTVTRDRIIAIIEVLSPANKTPGNPGRDQYLRKQADALESDAHLVEIDLLRQGAHTVAAPEFLLRARGSWHYLVCLHRATSRHAYEYWFVSMREPLPQVRVPLAAGVPDAVLDLQECFSRGYDTGPYSRDIDYRQGPPDMLHPQDCAWANSLLRSKGLRG